MPRTSTIISIAACLCVVLCLVLLNREPFVPMYYPPRLAHGDFYRHPTMYKQPGDTQP
jgi:hypothetical protein